jgi:hypothetical protein
MNKAAVAELTDILLTNIIIPNITIMSITYVTQMSMSMKLHAVMLLPPSGSSNSS